MKTKLIILSIALCIPVFTVNAQWINSINMVPTNPTELDTIYIYIDVSFPSGPCHEKTITTSAIPPNLYANALHCLGPLTVICDHVDTIVYYQMPPGNYNFTFQVDAGGSPSPCTPGINPGPSDNINFTVVPFVSVEQNSVLNNINLFPNPAIDKFYFELNNYENDSYLVEILSIQGRLLMKHDLKEKREMDVSSLENGMYIVRLFNNKNLLTGVSKITINK